MSELTPPPGPWRHALDASHSSVDGVLRDAGHAWVCWQVAAAEADRQRAAIERLWPGAALILRVQHATFRDSGPPALASLDLPVERWVGARYAPMGPAGTSTIFSLGLKGPAIEGRGEVFVPLARSAPLRTPRSLGPGSAPARWHRVAAPAARPAVAPVLVFHAPPVNEEGPSEAWLVDTVIDAWIPVTALLEELSGDGVAAPVTLAVSSAALGALDDPATRARCAEALETRLTGARQDAERLADSPLGDSARDAVVRLERALDAWRRWDRDLPSVWGRLQERGALSVIPAVGAALPLVASEAVRRAHIRGAVEATRGRFKRVEPGLWLAACAYDPRLDDALVAEGIAWTCIAPHGAALGDAAAALGALGPLRTPVGLTCLPLHPGPVVRWEPGQRSDYRRLGADAQPATLDPMAWLPAALPMGDARHLRASGPHAAIYDPLAANAQARAHARAHVEALISELLEASGDLQSSAAGGCPAATVAWMASSFGAGWEEGAEWLRAWLRAVAERPEVEVCHAEALHGRASVQVVTPEASSLLEGGLFGPLLAPSHDWVLRHVRGLERDVAALRDLFADGGQAPERAQRRGADLAVRELMLAQAMEWPLLIGEGRDAQHGVERAQRHIDLAHQLAGQVTQRRLDRSLLERLTRRRPLHASIELLDLQQP